MSINELTNDTPDVIRSLSYITRLCHFSTEPANEGSPALAIRLAQHVPQWVDTAPAALMRDDRNARCLPIV